MHQCQLLGYHLLQRQITLCIVYSLHRSHAFDAWAQIASWEVKDKLLHYRWVWFTTTSYFITESFATQFFVSTKFGGETSSPSPPSVCQLISRQRPSFQFHYCKQKSSRKIAIGGYRRYIQSSSPSFNMVLSQEDIDGCREAFLAFDKDRSGTIDVWELRQVLEAMGQAPTEDELFQVSLFLMDLSKRHC